MTSNQIQRLISHLISIDPGNYPPCPPLIFNRCPNGIAEEKAEIIDFHIELANERRVFDTEGDLAVSSMVSCECAATPAMPNT